MENKLHYITTSPLLLDVLKKLVNSAEFQSFRLVGGTALSLQRGHRISVDIDLFTDSTYGTIDFGILETYLKANWPYVDTTGNLPVGMGKPFFVGLTNENCIKLDLYYTDGFIDNFQLLDGIRLATVEEIIAMKIDVICRGGRKKDFWDVHELMDNYSLARMLDLHEKRYPYNHDRIHLINKFTDFTQADNDFDPVCLRGKYWEIIKLDLIEFAKSAKL